jgi:hypothetical protein
MAREEFKRHKNAKPQFLGPFYEGWEKYVKDLSFQDALMGDVVGADIDQSVVATLTDEQQVRTCTASRAPSRDRVVAAW